MPVHLTQICETALNGPKEYSNTGAAMILTKDTLHSFVSVTTFVNDVCSGNLKLCKRCDFFLLVWGCHQYA